MGDKERILASIRKSKNSRATQLGEPPVFENSETSDELQSLLEIAKKMITAVGGEVLLKQSEEFLSRQPREDELIIRGEFLVAENGAIWVEPEKETDRSSIFLAEHLVIEVPEKELVPDMHAAYERLEGRLIEYGTFVSGPSKTADIEQSLVIGAQGPRSCLIVLT